MTVEEELDHLAGEALAIQRFLVALCARLSFSSPVLRDIIEAAFDEAAGDLETQTIVGGSKVPPGHLAHSLRVVEDLRTAALGDHKPQHQV